jgi:hypothetical protein
MKLGALGDYKEPTIFVITFRNERSRNLAVTQIFEVRFPKQMESSLSHIGPGYPASRAQ